MDLEQTYVADELDSRLMKEEKEININVFPFLSMAISPSLDTVYCSLFIFIFMVNC